MEMVFPSLTESNKKHSKFISKIKIVASGQSKIYKIPSERILFNDNDAHFIGSLSINMHDFDIEPPVRAFGTIKVSPILMIKYDFILIQ